MRLPPIVTKTIKSTKREITVFIITSAILILVYNLYMDSLFILYPLSVSMAILLVYLTIKGISLASFYKRLENAKSPSDNYGSDDYMQTLVFETISDIHEKYLGQINQLNTQINTRNALFSQFIHGMKSSVSIIELACEKYCIDDSPEHSLLPDTPIFDITVENEKLKKNLEQSLNLLRLDAFANDYVPERVDLAALVTRVINDHKRDFIYAGVFPKLNGEAVVYTDSKWCGFIISQLISNSIKYSNASTNVMFDIEILNERTELRITDYGIGIPCEDLPRVFDMFFTGTNGRQRRESTGIGLFMVKYIAEKLGIGLHIASEFGKSTTVILSFRILTKL